MGYLIGRTFVFSENDVFPIDITLGSAIPSEIVLLLGLKPKGKEKEKKKDTRPTPANIPKLPPYLAQMFR